MNKRNSKTQRCGKSYSKRSSRPRRKTSASSSSSEKYSTWLSSTSTISLPESRIDLSWKKGGKNFPKLTSRIGAEYNATNMPSAASQKGSYDDQSNDKSGCYCYQIWDPQRAKENGVLNLIENKIPSNKKEACLEILSKLNYDSGKFLSCISNVMPMDGSNWTDEEKNHFRDEIFRLRKDVYAVSKSMNKSMNASLSYYLGTYKITNDYQVLKVICSEEKRCGRNAANYYVTTPNSNGIGYTRTYGNLGSGTRYAASGNKSSSGGSNSGQPSYVVNLDACALCGDGGSLLICDGCEGEYHMGCLKPALQCVPEGKWECDECVDRKFLAARDCIVRNTTLYQRVQLSKQSELSSTPITAAITSGIPISDEKRSGIDSSIAFATVGSTRDSKDNVSTKNDGNIITTNIASPVTCRVAFYPAPEVLTAVQVLAQNISRAFQASEDFTSVSDV